MAGSASQPGKRGPEEQLHGVLGRVLDAMPDGIVVCDVRGVVAYANARVDELTGYARDELVGQPVEVLVPESVRSSHHGHRGRYSAQGFPMRDMGTELNTRLRRKDGTEVPVDIALAAMRTDDGELVVAALRDATERRRVAAMVREAERRQQLLLENVPLLVVALTPDGRVTYVNPHFEEATGYSLQDLSGKDPFEVFLTDPSRAEARQDFDRVREGEIQERYEIPIRTRSGALRTISWYSTLQHGPGGEISGMISIGQDITETRQTTLRLQAVNEFARLILSGEQAATSLAHVARSARELAGATMAFVATLHDDEFVVVAVDGDASPVVAGLRYPVEGTVSGRVVAERHPVLLEHASAGSAASSAPLVAAAMGPAIVVPLGEERVQGVLGVGNRPGERLFDADDLQAIGLLASQAEVVLEYSRMQEELRFVAILQDRERIARDLHDGAIQSLFGIGLRLQALARTDEAREAPWIDESVEALNSAIRDIRAYIHELRTDVLSRSTLTAALHRLALEFQGRSGVRVALDVDAQSSDALEPAAHDVVQFVNEALSNVGKHAAASAVRVRVGGRADEALIEVADDGRGFDPDDRQEGLGLANLAARAESLGGRLDVRSSPGTGTVVSVRVDATEGG